jgi:hypothetical protein
VYTFQILNALTDFNQIWYERYAIGGISSTQDDVCVTSPDAHVQVLSLVRPWVDSEFRVVKKEILASAGNRTPVFQ